METDVKTCISESAGLVQVSMTLEVTADTAIAARDKASTLASSVLGTVSAVCAVSFIALGLQKSFVVAYHDKLLTY